MIRRPPKSPLFPSTTLFRSAKQVVGTVAVAGADRFDVRLDDPGRAGPVEGLGRPRPPDEEDGRDPDQHEQEDRKSTRLNSSHANISYAVFCLKKKKKCIDIS